MGQLENIKEEFMQHANDPNAPVATPLNYPEHFPTEPSNVHLAIPKGQDYRTSLQQRVELVPVRAGHIANLQKVLYSCAPSDARIRALNQLKRNVERDDCEESAKVLAQWQDSGLTIN